MQEQRVQNNNCNVNPYFKGNVSPEFVEYVNAIRKDCLKITHKDRDVFLINKIADNIIDYSNEVTNEFFHPDSVISIDSTYAENNDTIVILNNLISNFVAGVRYVHKYVSPIRKLRTMRYYTLGRGELFPAALTRENLLIQDLVYYGSPKGKELAKKMLEWRHENNNLDYSKLNSRHYKDTLYFPEDRYNELMSLL